jgi:XTP/dITP diphosphohydrolase
MQLPRRLVVASQNPDKIAEVHAVLAALDLGVEVVRGLKWPPVPETEDTIAGNALLKARAVCAHTGIASVADDTGLEVAALGGAPGVHSARFAGAGATYQDNVTLLLERMRGVSARTAWFRTAVALVTPEGEELVVHGELEGSIATAPRGERGFGYDPVFEVAGRTLAEMTEAEKNLVSHRARALRALAAALSERTDPGPAGPGS